MKIFDHHIAPQMLLIVVIDLLLAAASLLLAYAGVHASGFAAAVPQGVELIGRSFLFAIAIVAGLAAMGLYSVQQRYRMDGVLARMVVGVGLAMIGLALLHFVFKFVESRLLWGVALILTIVLLAVARAFYSRFIDDEIFRRRVLVYGAGRRAGRILELRRRSDQRGFRITAFVPAAGDSCVADDYRVLKHPHASLKDYVRLHEVDEIVMAADDRRQSFPVSDLLACKLAGIRIIDLLEFLERETGRVKVDMMNPAWLIFSDGFNRTGGKLLSFRLLDLVAATLFSVVALPIGLLVALAIVIDDGGPVLYRQRRVGLDNRVFVLNKFRSMRNDAEAGGARWAEKEDDRATGVGRVLRKFRLDEIPQLINVFKGDMSFVGPRPERPEFVSELARKIPYYHERHCVKPGLTGWAQLCYPYGASERDAQSKLEYDMYYVKNRSLVFNLMILLQTAEVVLWQKGSR